MASVLALLGAAAFKKHAKQFAPGAVIPIDSFVTDDRSFATELSHGGALYLAVLDSEGALWLVAVLEAPETSGLRKADKRKPGWYSPPNATPVTDITKLRGKLKLGKDLDAAFERPRILTPAMDRALREILDDVDAPVIAHLEPVAKAPELDAKLPPLERARQLLGGGHVAPAIQAIAEAWRASRAPQLADLVDRATRLQPEYHRPLFDKRMSWDDDKAADKVWDQAFDADPVTAMPQLLLNLAVGGGSTAITRRTKRLAGLPLDPRFGARLVELMSFKPRWDERRWWPPVVDMWLKSKDARTFESLLELELEETHLGTKTSNVYAMARTEPPKLPARDEPQVTAIEAELHRLEEPLRTEYALVDQMAAHPDDDGPYLVYADWLIERGRPLGEFITLTCQQRSGALTPAQARRLAILVEVPYLCGVFDDMPSVRMRKRERGVDRALQVYWSTQPRSWRLFAASPLTRALTRVELVSTPLVGRDKAIAEFIRAAPVLERMANVGKKCGNAVVKLLDGAFEVQRGLKEVAMEGGRPDMGWDLVRVTRAGRSR